jgi:hypothetical protein
VGSGYSTHILATMAESINLYEGSAEFILVSNDGTVVAAGKHPDAIGKPLVESGISGLEDEVKAIETGNEHVDISGSTLVAFTPFTIGKVLLHGRVFWLFPPRYYCVLPCRPFSFQA